MSARVVGLDLSLSATGIAAVDGTTRTVTPKTDGDRRLLEIAREVWRAAATEDLVVIEDGVVRSPAAFDLGMLHGSVRRELMQARTQYVLITPATLKKFATGRGNATKPDMRMALYQRMGIDLRDDNQVDATWLRYAGLQLLGEPVVQLPATQVAALDKVRGQLGDAS